VIAPKFQDMVTRLLTFIQHNPTHKAIVYSQYLSKGLYIAENLLKQHNISYVKFTGQETENQKKNAVERYNSDQVQVFLISSAGGLGLDLKNTDSVHIMEPAWNLAKISQVIYRAVRYKSHSTPNAIVKVYKYYSYKPTNILKSIWKTLFFSSSRHRKKPLELSADIYLKQVSIQKDKINQKFLQYAIQHSIEQQSRECKITELYDAP
jgi:superfamily II DNA/RNA helicase